MTLRQRLSDSERAQLIESAALAVHCLAWADAQELAGRSLSGCNLTEVADPVTDEAKDWGRDLIAAVEKANPKADYAAIMSAADFDACCLDGFDRLGHCLAMEAMGTCVAWTNDYPEHGLKVPDRERLLYSDPPETPDRMAKRLAESYDNGNRKAAREEIHALDGPSAAAVGFMLRDYAAEGDLSGMRRLICDPVDTVRACSGPLEGDPHVVLLYEAGTEEIPERVVGPFPDPATACAYGQAQRDGPDGREWDAVRLEKVVKPC